MLTQEKQNYIHSQGVSVVSYCPVGGIPPLVLCLIFLFEALIRIRTKKYSLQFGICLSLVVELKASIAE